MTSPIGGHGIRRSSLDPRVGWFVNHPLDGSPNLITFNAQGAPFQMGSMLFNGTLGRGKGTPTFPLVAH